MKAFSPPQVTPHRRLHPPPPPVAVMEPFVLGVLYPPPSPSPGFLGLSSIQSAQEQHQEYPPSLSLSEWEGGLNGGCLQCWGGVVVSSQVEE